MHSPYTFDVYSAGLVWLRVAVPSLTSNEAMLYALRLELRRHRHEPQAWRRACTPPEGWEAVFGEATSEQRYAWELLVSLLAYEPSDRPSAAEALIGPYLNFDCSTGEAPLPAPQPWTLEGLFSSAGEFAGTGSGARTIVADECELPEDGIGAPMEA